MSKVKQLIKELNDAPQLIHAAEYQYFIDQEILATLQDRITELKDLLYLEICSERDEKGKSIYSNETLREIELKRRVIEMPELRARTSGLATHREKLQTSKCNLERHKNQMKVNLAILNYLSSIGGELNDKEIQKTE